MPLTPSRTATGRPPTAAATHRGAAGLGLDRDQAERLAVRRHDQHGGGPVPVRELVLRRPAAGTARRRRCPSRAASFCSRSGLARPVPLGPPTTGTTRRARSDGSLLQEAATARSRTSGAFSGWMRPTKSGISASCGRPSRARAAARPSPPGPETVEVDPGVDDGDLVGVGLVVADEFARLLGGVGDQPVGGADDLGLADHAGGRLGGVAGGQRGVLDLGHGVHGVHQRHAPALGGQPADVAGEPVVGVDEVVVAGAVAGPGLHHPVREGAQLGRAAPPWPGPRTGRRPRAARGRRGELDGRAAGRRWWRG